MNEIAIITDNSATQLLNSANSKSDQSRMDLVIAVDLGGTHLRVASVDSSGKILARQTQATPHAQDPQEIVRVLLDGARACARESGEAGGRVCALSVVVPGTVNVLEGVVVTAPNVPSLDGFGLVAALQSECEWPVILENDGNAAAIGESWRGAGKECSSLICVTLGTGVGGGIILDGKLWRGSDGAAGEIGHIAVDPFAGVACSCGSQGCLEVYASATAVVRMTREARLRYPDSMLHNATDLTSQKIYQAGKEGDELAIEVFRRMGVYLGIGLASLINILNPETIVIGGGLANGWDLFETPMHQQVIKRAFPIPAGRAKILRAECCDDAGLLGAARLAFTDLP